LLGIIFILEISAGIAAYVMRNEVEMKTEAKMRDSMQTYNKSSNLAKKSWDMLQTELDCCGVRTYSEWDAILGTPGIYPPSCCKVGQPPCRIDGVAKQGCLGKLTDKIVDNVSVIGGIGVGVAFIQVRFL
jgi:CD63 antigen